MKVVKLTTIAVSLMLLLASCAWFGVQTDNDSGMNTGASNALTRDNFPKLDGSTATIPLGQALVSVMLDLERTEAAPMIEFSGTTKSYERLINGNADLLLAYEPSDAALALKDEQKFEWDMAPIGRDALVFIVNESNPLDNLTTEQLGYIYSGKITNWSLLGGEDKMIEAFQRNESSGSQTLFNKLLMKNTAPMKPPTEYVLAEMNELIDAVASYNNSGTAIGYSVYFYAKNMNPADGLKYLSVDGVAPTTESIESGEYPFVNDFYAVIDKSAAKDSTQRAIYEWLQGKQGQQLVKKEGYAGINNTNS